MRGLDLNVPFGFWLVALVLFVLDALGQRTVLRRVGMACLGLGWLAQTAGLGWRAWAAGRAPMSNMHESLLVMAWGALLLFLFYARRPGMDALGGWVAALLLLLLGGASLLDPSIQPLMPALQSNWLLYHVVVIMLSYGALALAATAGLLFLVKFRAVDRSQSELWDRAKAIESFMHRSASLGFLLLSGGIILGAVWVNEAWGSYWSWDPKETWALISWLVYAVALHLWKARGWRGSRFAWLNVIGFIVVIFTYVGVNYLLSGMHSYAGR